MNIVATVFICALSFLSVALLRQSALPALLENGVTVFTSLALALAFSFGYFALFWLSSKLLLTTGSKLRKRYYSAPQKTSGNSQDENNTEKTYRSFELQFRICGIATLLTMLVITVFYTSGMAMLFAQPVQQSSDKSDKETSAKVTALTGPTLTVSSLTNGAATNQTPLNISGTVADASGIASLTSNGAVVTVSGTGSYTYALLLNTEGNVAITVVATDNAGNSSTNSRTINYDTTLPTISVTAPADNSQTKDAPLTVTGTVSENCIVEIKNTSSSISQLATVTGTNFIGTIQLVSGSNTIEVTVTDLAGNKSASVKRTVLYDPASPALAITEPNHDILVNNVAVTIKGTVSDQTSTSVKLSFNGTDYPQTVASGQFQQSLTIPAEGSYTVTVTATDSVGNAPATATRNIIYTPYPGDSNGDGSTTSLVEALKAFKYAHGQGTLTPVEILRLDCAPLGSDGKPAPNGVVDGGDVLL